MESEYVPDVDTSRSGVYIYPGAVYCEGPPPDSYRTLVRVWNGYNTARVVL